MSDRWICFEDMWQTAHQTGSKVLLVSGFKPPWTFAAASKCWSCRRNTARSSTPDWEQGWEAAMLLGTWGREEMRECWALGGLDMLTQARSDLSPGLSSTSFSNGSLKVKTSFSSISSVLSFEGSVSVSLTVLVWLWPSCQESVRIDSN